VSGFVPFVFTDQQATDIRRFCGYPAQANGNVLFNAPWVNVQYLALDYRIPNLSLTEGGTVAAMLVVLNTLEGQIDTAAAGLDVGTAGPYIRNPEEMRERERNFAVKRRRLCQHMGVPPGPCFEDASDSSVSFIV
jgi:hypothetical protein